MIDPSGNNSFPALIFQRQDLPSAAGNRYHSRRPTAAASRPSRGPEDGMDMKHTLIALGFALAGCAGGADVEDSMVQESKIPVGLGRYRTAFVEVDTQDPEQQEGVF